jgi:hypothetical protein
MDQPTGSKFESWAVVELFGHQREAGFVTTQYFGDKAMFQLDVPALEEREVELKVERYIGGIWAQPCTKVSRPAVPGRSRLLGPGAIYALNPCSKEAAMAALEEMTPREIKIVELAPKQQIAQVCEKGLRCAGCDAVIPELGVANHLPECEFAPTVEPPDEGPAPRTVVFYRDKEEPASAVAPPAAEAAPITVPQSIDEDYPF